jgi:hypothetical protein
VLELEVGFVGERRRRRWRRSGRAEPRRWRHSEGERRRRWWRRSELEVHEDGAQDEAVASVLEPCSS